MEIPKRKTKDDAINEMRDQGVPITERAFRVVIGDFRHLPEYSSPEEIMNLANKDLKNMDFNSIRIYLNELYESTQYFKKLAENYLTYLDLDKYRLDKDGFVEELTTNN